jgi:putative DNA primase/helicase
MTSVIDLFREAMRCAGIEPPADIIADGEIHRFNIAGHKRYSLNGWYLLYADHPAAGYFGCWKRDFKTAWSAKQYRRMAADEKAAFKAKMKRIRRRWEEEQRRVHAACRERSGELWEQASPAYDHHPYLKEKQVKPYDLKWYRGALLVPVRDLDGNLHGLQKIWRAGDGGKSFELGTAVTAHFHVIGSAGGDTILICEGYATGASLHEATGLPVVVAFDAANLKPVAEVLRVKFPNSHLVIAADNDRGTDGNPGITKATEAADAVMGAIVVPIFADTTNNPTDFNDLLRAEGNEAVRRTFQRQGVTCV